ncbi:MAG: HlyD family efflux transporter periplasmic adaptor subunit [Anaerolineales bacterium]|nr:HlyD family efflux transporter periplasmic adaptor subunit [Anaerolineales bacterium]MCZ2121928.1 HlyD family efflux transporter periplasmic adaptor subunit [Anaerolineales bacterium]
MKIKFEKIFFLCAWMLTACASPTSALTPLAAPTTVPVSTNIAHAGNNVSASARVVPSQTAEIAFAISGQVKDVYVKEGEVVEAGQTLLALNAPDLELAVKAAELAVQSAELEYQYWIPRKDRPPERRAQAEAQLNAVKAQLETAQARLAQSVLLAPFDATVMSIQVQSGELAQAGQVVITLGATQSMQIKTTDLSERDAVNVRVGQSVNIYLEALGKNIAGKVSEIAPLATTVGGDVVYPVMIELNEQVAGLLWGMTAEVQIQIE